jgi:hypothetical protein
MISEIFADSIYSIHSLGRGLLQDSEHTDSESLAAPGSSSSAASTTSSASTASSFSSVASRANAASPWQQLRFTESDRRPLTRIMALDRWCEIIRIYTDLDLTYETDRQVAISGVVRCLDPSMNCKYVAGIWDHEVELQLLWQCLDDWKRTSVSKVPSWSWASSPGPVLHAISVYNIRTHIRPDLFKVLGIEAKPKEEDNNSPMNNCHLRVVGRLTPVTLTNDSQWPQPGRPNTVKIRKESFRFTPDKFCGPGKYYSSTLLYYVQENRYCTSVDGLIWTPTGKKRGEFQRVGLFSGNWKRLCSIRELDDLGACVCGRGDAREKAQMTEDLYETYDEEKDVYTFTIV